MAADRWLAAPASGPAAVFFAAAANAEAVVLRKPAGPFFETAVAMRGGGVSDASEVLMIGDDVGAAQRAGLRGVLVRTASSKSDGGVDSGRSISAASSPGSISTSSGRSPRGERRIRRTPWRSCFELCLERNPVDKAEPTGASWGAASAGWGISDHSPTGSSACEPNRDFWIGIPLASVPSHLETTTPTGQGIAP